MTVQALEQALLNFSLILPRLFSCFIVLPILGMIWLWRRRPARVLATEAA